MNLKQTLAELERLGTAQNRKVYARHGVRGPAYGVSFANLGKLVKTIRVDQQLAEGLWKSGNHDARVLATMIADPNAISSRQLDAWARDVDNYVVADALSGLVAKSPQARRKFEVWSRRKGEFVAQVAWNVFSHLTRSDADLPDSYFERQLEVIERQIHQRPDRTRYAMNLGLIAIGIRNAGLEKKAIAAAKRIGQVEVDHGETGCKTPDAIPYIQRARKRLADRAKKVSKKAKTRATKKGGRKAARG